MTPTSDPKNLDLTPESQNSSSTWEEIGFAEFPIVTTSIKRPPTDTLEFIETIGTDAAGEPIHRGWQIVGSSEYGLPRLPDLDLFMAILKLCEETKYEKRLLMCTISKLERLVGLKHGGQTYQRFRSSAMRFQTSSYVAKNIFFHPKTKERVVSEGWSIVSDHRLLPDTRNRAVRDGLPPSYIAIGAGFLDRLRNGQMKPIDLALWRQLPLGIEKPIFHLLDKNFYQLTKGQGYEIGLRRLSRKIGVTGTYRNPQLKRLFEKPLANLVNLGFLERYTFEPASSKEDQVKLIAFPGSKARRRTKTSAGVSIHQKPSSETESHRFDASEQHSAADLVREFHELISGQKPENLDRAELAKARKLLKLQGSQELATYTVSFAVNAGRQTGFDMKNFGAVLSNNYPANARIEHERDQRQREEAQRLQEQQATELRYETWFDDQWEQLPVEDRKLLEEEVRPAATKDMSDRNMTSLSDSMRSRLLQHHVDARARRLYRQRLQDAGKYPSE